MVQAEPNALAGAPVVADVGVAEPQGVRPGSSASDLPLPENVCGMLAYLFLPAIVFLSIGRFKRNRFVRFHSVQCLMIVGILLVLHVVVAIYGRFEPMFALPLYGLLLLADLTLWLLLLLKAYQHVRFKLPYIGDFAEEWARR